MHIAGTSRNLSFLCMHNKGVYIGACTIYI